MSWGRIFTFDIALVPVVNDHDCLSIVSSGYDNADRLKNLG
jgi:hypothetical protein